ncbi:hypothetical protein Lser_V15G20093 [Lactuca serriola]
MLVFEGYIIFSLLVLLLLLQAHSSPSRICITSTPPAKLCSSDFSTRSAEIKRLTEKLTPFALALDAALQKLQSIQATFPSIDPNGSISFQLQLIPSVSINFDLLVHVMVDSLSRLPLKTIIHCKCVYKKWLDLVSDSYFVNLHLSRSPVGLMIYHYLEKELMGHPKLRILKWAEVKDKVNHHNLHHDPVMSLDLNLVPIFQDSQILLMGSVNGLICLWQVSAKSDNIYICNPITREYMILPRQQYHGKGYAINVHCFGVSLLSHEYKVIQIFQRVLILPLNLTSSSSS